MRHFLLACATLALALLVGACGSDDGAASGGGLRVVATTTQVADLARNVAGDRASVTGILTPNADPHDYEPRPGDAKALADADVVLRSGADVDDWLGDLLKSAGSGAETVTLIDHVQAREGGGHAHEEDEEHAGEEHAEDDLDPHWWQDPRNAELAVKAIRDALAKADPDGAATYDANATAYLGRLRALDTAIARCMDEIPADRRKLVTNHDALGYFAERYGIEVVGAVIPALSTAARASAGETRDLIATIRREHVTTIFPESSVNPKLEKAIAAEADAKVGPALWADTLGPKGSDGATYLQSLRSNALAMAEGFSGDNAHCDLPR
jgi:zinc/manganese transport system substrate-binding protein/manganese/iron transport system substrate-binding protein